MGAACGARERMRRVGRERKESGSGGARQRTLDRPPVAAVQPQRLDEAAVLVVGPALPLFGQGVGLALLRGTRGGRESGVG